MQREACWAWGLSFASRKGVGTIIMRIGLMRTMIFVLVSLGLAGMPVEALNVTTHRIVNEQAVRRSNLDRVLKRQLGIPRGIEQEFAGIAALRWVGEGGIREDDGNVWDGTGRFLRHFHDPLKPWDRAGLDLGFKRWESSVVWMQRPGQGGDTGGTGDWSWREARDFYAKALLEGLAGDRDQGWAHTFRALGQAMHLVVDASVPEHVRNDMHPLGPVNGNYEYWVEAQHGKPGSPLEGQFTRLYTLHPIAPDPVIWRRLTTHPTAASPVAWLIDNDIYTGADPNVTTKIGGKVLAGIAEVANANFFSEDTGHFEYPHPDVRRLIRSKYPAPKTGRARGYYSKPKDEGLPADPALAECALDEAVARSGGPGAPPHVTCVDENVWTQTAAAMLPRAVGYAATVLDYFFRGTLSTDVQVYKQDNQLHASVTITNETPGEEMDGSFVVLYDLPGGQRTALALWALVLGAAGSSTATSQMLSISPLPPDVPATGWILVFQGRLGEERGAVAARRVGGNYVGSFGVYVSSIPSESFSWGYPYAVGDGSQPQYLTSGDHLAFTAVGSPESSRIVRIKTTTVWHRDATVADNVVEIEPVTAWISCGGYDSLYYGYGPYRPFGYFIVLPPTTASASLVELEAPATLAELYGYTYDQRPAVRRIFRIVDSSDPPFRLDLTGVRFLGLLLNTAPARLSSPTDVAWDANPSFTSQRGCGATVLVRRPQ